MALVLKATKTYTDIFTDGTSDSYYGVVDVCNLNKHDCKAMISFQIYKSSSERTNGKSPIKTFSYTVSKDKYPNYFNVGLLDTAGVDQFQEAYLYILNEVREPSTFDENGDEVLGALVWADWESDEV
jgi:hypothetical protein